MSRDPLCTDCRAPAPGTETRHTLIGSFGWRVVPRTLPDGSRVMEWRCAACWARWKAREGGATEGMPGPAHRGKRGPG